MDGGYDYLYPLTARRAVLLRHPDLIWQGREIYEALQPLIGPTLGQEYSQLARLSATLGRRYRATAERMLKLVEIGAGVRKVNPGPFCSELIVMAFDILQLPLFDPPRKPGTVAPTLCSKRL